MVDTRTTSGTNQTQSRTATRLAITVGSVGVLLFPILAARREPGLANAFWPLYTTPLFVVVLAWGLFGSRTGRKLPLSPSRTLLVPASALVVFALGYGLAGVSGGYGSGIDAVVGPLVGVLSYQPGTVVAGSAFAVVGSAVRRRSVPGVSGGLGVALALTAAVNRNPVLGDFAFLLGFVVAYGAVFTVLGYATTGPRPDSATAHGETAGDRTATAK